MKKRKECLIRIVLVKMLKKIKKSKNLLSPKRFKDNKYNVKNKNKQKRKNLNNFNKKLDSQRRLRKLNPKNMQCF